MAIIVKCRGLCERTIQEVMKILEEVFIYILYFSVVAQSDKPP